MWDADGVRYLDLLAGIAVNSLGHAHPRLVSAIAEQAGTLMHISNLFASEPQVALAERLDALVAPASPAARRARSSPTRAPRPTRPPSRSPA